MPQRKISDLSEKTSLAALDKLTMLDTADTSIAASGRWKWFSPATLWLWILGQFNANATDVAFSDPNGTILMAAQVQPTTDKMLYADSAGTVKSSANQASLRLLPVCFVLGGDTGAITTGVKYDFVIPVTGTIKKVTTLADQTGSIVVDLWKDTYANYPPTVADTITASAKPTLSSAVKAQDATLTGWTTSVTAGDIIRVNVDSATTVTRVSVVLEIEVA